MIINFEKNPFLKSSEKHLQDLDGIWISGEGLLFFSEKDASTYYKRTCTGNEMNPQLFTVQVDGKNLFKKLSTNVFD